ncbi:unnamed protein product [Cladocopium goreaui]|uniref:Uncharacterized protein n=1 Tax=Cladocopium goreaui TaxID=2562237 RepID=A0A9P1DUP9_9DINO|nr:unnamed protein product [Cladocopium goreaui]
MVVDSQTATGAPETPCREAWTDAQPRESPVYYSPRSLPGASAEVGTPQVKLPDAEGAPEQAVLCTPKEAQIPAPNEESDVGDSASIAPEPESKRKKIKQMLAEHGTFTAMEIQLKKIHQKERSQTVGGGWCSETFLRTEKKWDKQMIASAYAWAEKNGRKRVNPVHGKWEIQLVLDDTFELKNKEVEETERSGGLTVEDEEGTLFDSEIPDVTQPMAALPAAPAGDGKDVTSSVGNASAVMSFKLTFPTVTATTTPLQVLPQFVQVLGQKIDKVQAEMDRFADVARCVH